jgi:hypothetical protein
MLQALKTRLVECDHPVGQKKSTNWKLPPVDFSYGKPHQSDKEGVGISKFKFNLKLQDLGKNTIHHIKT